MGWEVIYVVAVDSVYVFHNYQPPNKTFSELTHEDILSTRENESTQGAKALGTSEPVFLHLKPSYHWTNETTTHARVHFNDEDDDIIEGMKSFRGKYFCLQAARTQACVDEIAEFIKSYEPEIVLTQQPNDLHLEHYSISCLAFVACRQLLQQGMSLKLYAWEMGSIGRLLKFTPDVVVDISDTFDIKLESIKPFISQQSSDDLDMFERHVRNSGSYWGKKIGTAFAEPFSELLIHAPKEGSSLSEEEQDRFSQYLDHCKSEL